MKYTDGFGKPLSKGQQIIIGAVDGTAAIHVAPIGIPVLLSKLGDKETSPLEKIAASVIAGLEGAAYYSMMRKGIPVEYILSATNILGTAVIGLLLSGVPGMMHDMVNGGGFEGISLNTSPRNRQLEPHLEKSSERAVDVYYL